MANELPAQSLSPRSSKNYRKQQHTSKQAAKPESTEEMAARDEEAQGR
jgi:hypothetical protein